LTQQAWQHQTLRRDRRPGTVAAHVKTTFLLHYVRRSAALSTFEHEDTGRQDSLYDLRSITGITTSLNMWSAMERFISAAESFLRGFRCTGSLDTLKLHKHVECEAMGEEKAFRQRPSFKEFRTAFVTGRTEMHKIEIPSERCSKRCDLLPLNRRPHRFNDDVASIASIAIVSLQPGR